ncbi:hypothetical protein JVU11DRAFT_9778 [Chiua virens]|nr:hypothetical protein JVU11DRAFT_9778 [Chiua virens]
MDSRRAETLEALSAYLQHQRTLLARTQADIERLKTLKAEALVSPEQFVNRSSFQGNDASTSPHLQKIEEKTSELQDYHPAQSFPTKIDWETLSSSDATPLRTLAIRTRIEHTQRVVPSNTQQSSLSFLQKFVKDARKVILDPVFETLTASTDMVEFSNPTVTSNPHDNSSSNDHNDTTTLTLPPSLSEDENEEHQQAPLIQESMTTIRKRERARTKIRELKKRKIKTDLIVGCKPGEEGSDGVFVRTDIGDDGTEVDMRIQTPPSCTSMQLDGHHLDQISDTTDINDTSPLILQATKQCVKLRNLPGTRQFTVSRREFDNRSPRTRKPTLKLQSLTALTELNEEPLGKRSRDVAGPNDTICKLKTEPVPVLEANAEAENHRSNTYKQAWSISEQHLLERLLEEIPDGERNRYVLRVSHWISQLIGSRWAKISQAMGGRRTPRQVASRVQKYFEKLKRFGVGVDKKGKAKS